MLWKTYKKHWFQNIFVWFDNHAGDLFLVKNIYMEKVRSEKSPRILEKANTRDTKVAKWRNSSDRLEVDSVGQYDKRV